MLNEKMEEQKKQIGMNFRAYIKPRLEEEIDYDKELNDYIEQHASEELKQYIKEREKVHEEAWKKGTIID